MLSFNAFLNASRPQEALMSDHGQDIQDALMSVSVPPYCSIMSEDNQCHKAEARDEKGS